MKRRDLENLIEDLKYIVNGRPVPIPRHREIGEQLAKEIVKQTKKAIGGDNA